MTASLIKDSEFNIVHIPCIAGSIPDGVGIFHWHNPSGRTMALKYTTSNKNEYQEYFLG